MESAFWLDRWRGGQIGFHQATVEPVLVEHFAALKLPADARVFVPLCGKSLDLVWLARRAQVTGVELSAVAVEAFWLENGIPARRRVTGHFEEYHAETLRLLLGDFFALNAMDVGAVDLVYDRAALISWSPESRARYVDHLTSLTKPGAQTLLLTLEYPPQETKGPPFSLLAGEVDQLYGAYHEVRLLSRQDVLAQDARMRARGVTQLHQACYWLKRL